ncbi:MAG: bacteriohemerythrin [Magnetococcales bacterium]|nr:bacteriohemerythrin [Magnetococcales bacterium]
MTDKIMQISETNREITNAVDGQAQSVDEITASMNEVSTASDEVTRNASELAMASQEVARAAMEAATGTAEIAQSASTVAHDATLVAEDSAGANERAASVKISSGEIYEASVHVQKMMIKSMELVRYMGGSVEYFSRLSDVLKECSDALKQAEKGLTIEDASFEVRTVKQAHLKWLGRLEQVIRGRDQLKPEEVVGAHDCAFGKWYDSQGTTVFDSLPLFHEMGEAHEKVHVMAREVVGLVAEAKPDEAVAKMADFESLRQDLFNLLDQLYLVEQDSIGRPEKEQKRYSLMPWTDSLKVHIKVIDDDHRRLVDMINDLYTAMRLGRGRVELGRILDALVEYTANHFNREEVMFKKHGYPETKEHLAEHEKLVSQVLEFQRQFHEEGAMINMELMSFLKDWLFNHIMGVDQRYSKFLRSKGEK